MAKQIKKLPGVLSFQRCLIVTDGLFYNEMANGEISVLPVIWHGIRGTQNNFKSSKEEQAAAASAKRESVTNIQITHSAKLAPEAVALQVRFRLRGINLRSALFACAPSDKDDLGEMNTFKEQLADFVKKAIEGKALDSLASRYARNIANGRFLWRNRSIAKSVEVRVSLPDGSEKAFNALDIPLNRFEDFSPDELAVADCISRGWKGDVHAELGVVAHTDFGVGGAVEVFPSQNYLGDKENGFARSLYYVGAVPQIQEPHSIRQLGQAALRDQKIGNALRTVDTWYPDFAKRGVPIPVEPNGASLDAQMFFRDGSGVSGFALMLHVGEIDPASPEGQFLLACIIRGGVFSGGKRS